MWNPVKYLQAGAIVGFTSALPVAHAMDGQEHLHLAANLHGDYGVPASLGFNLADVSTKNAVNALPQGVKAVYWLGNGYNLSCFWRVSDTQVTGTVRAIKGHPKFSGIYYIADEPHPHVCPDAAQRLTERTALIHGLDPAAKTFALVLNGSTAPTEYAQLKDAVDYIGVYLYPCNRNNQSTGCSYQLLRQRIDQALAAGIPTSRIVPVFQTFGQECTVSSWSERHKAKVEPAKYYRLPTANETQSMLSIWDEKVPVAERPFDMAYSWGVQSALACPSLQIADGNAYANLRSVYAEYFGRMGTPGARR